jgi:hypothetical protein
MSASGLGTAGGDVKQTTAVPPGILRLVVVIGSVIMIGKWPIMSLLIFWIVAIWLIPRTYRDRSELAWLRSFHRQAKSRLSELEADLARAQHRIALLERERSNVEPSGQNHDSDHAIFRRVGLDQDCPRWVAETVRREYRRRLHPDSKPLGQKAEAERRFKEVEVVFDEIWRLRGF